MIPETGTASEFKQAVLDAVTVGKCVCCDRPYINREGRISLSICEECAPKLIPKIVNIAGAVIMPMDYVYTIQPNDSRDRTS